MTAALRSLRIESVTTRHLPALIEAYESALQAWKGALCDDDDLYLSLMAARCDLTPVLGTLPGGFSHEGMHYVVRLRTLVDSSPMCYESLS